MNSTQIDWKALWAQTLAGLPKKLWITDIDGTLYGDTLVCLNEALGPINPATGRKKWLDYDHAYKVAGTMTNGEHLIAEFQDLFATHTLDELVAWVKENVALIPGTPEFIAMLQNAGVGVVCISNGARQIHEPKLAHHNLPVRLIANWFEGNTLRFVHDENVGIDKGQLVDLAAEMGFEIVGFSGDAKGDIKGAESTARLGGLVLACGDAGLADWCRKNLDDDQWRLYTEFHSVMQLRQLQSRIGGN
jgi:2-hydroxy-3-keto-5-methylthiopentenyl-1-phosphate phosphatase